MSMNKSRDANDLIVGLDGVVRQFRVAVPHVAHGDGFVFTGIVAGFTNQQVFNDPNGDRWLLLVRRAMEMFLADIDRREKAAKAPKVSRPRANLRK